MNEPRRHHYVPQVYLRNFTIKGTNKLFVFDKILNKSYSAGIDKIAAERDFNMIGFRDDRMYWEKYYSKEIESRYPKIIRNLFSASMLSTNEAKILSDSLKRDIAFILITQLFRTPKARRSFYKIEKDAVKNKLEEMKTSLYPFLSESDKFLFSTFELSDDALIDIQLDTFNNQDLINYSIESLLKRKWIVYHNIISGSKPFVTSDHPVNYEHRVSHKSDFSSNGIDSNDSIIYFPVTKSLLIAIYPTEYTERGLKFLNDCVIKIDEPKFIKLTNKNQLLQCEKQIYSSTEIETD